MAQYLTQEWLDETRALAKGQPKRPGASATVQYVVTGGPDGDIKYSCVIKDGKPLESQIGVIPDAELTVTLPYSDSVAIAQGELDPSVAFMQGRMKAAGATGKLLQLLPIAQSEEYQALAAKVRSVTTF